MEKNGNTTENVSPIYMEQLKELQKLKKQYEELSKKSIVDPLLNEVTKFYGDNFDAKERMIGISLVKIKILPKIVPLVKKAINHMVVQEGLNIEDLEKDNNISKIFSYLVASGQYKYSTMGEATSIIETSKENFR